MAEATKNNVLFRVIPKIEELAGVDSEFGSREEDSQESG